MNCGQCGAENPSDHRYCGQCSHLLDDDAPVPRYRDRTSLLRREFVLIGAGMTVLLAAAFFAWYLFYFQNSPEMVVRHFMDADRKNQFAGQQQYVSNRWDAQMMLTAFQTIRKQAGTSPFASYRIVDASSSGKTAYVHVNLLFDPIVMPAAPLLAPFRNPAAPPRPVPPPATPNGKVTVPVVFTLNYEDNTWKIDSSQTLATVLANLAALGYKQFGPNLLNGGIPPGLQNLPGLTLPNLTAPNFTLPNITIPTVPQTAPPTFAAPEGSSNTL